MSRSSDSVLGAGYSELGEPGVKALALDRGDDLRQRWPADQVGCMRRAVPVNCADCKAAQKSWGSRKWVRVGRAHIAVSGCAHHLDMLEDQLSRSLARDPDLLPTPELIELSAQLTRRLCECQAEIDRRASQGLEAMPGDC